jgi:uncharacterized membrane protein HdeD (DUF308 family)
MALFWISLARGLMALLLGFALLLQAEKTRPLLINFMGVYWLASGATLLWSMLTGGQARRSLGIGGAIVALITGLAALLYSHFSGPSHPVVVLLGLVIVLTGALHFVGVLEVEQAHNRRLGPFVPLGLVEVILGALLVCSPLFRTHVTYWTASLWAAVAGAILLLDALHIRARVMPSRDKKTSGDPG